MLKFTFTASATWEGVSQQAKPLTMNVGLIGEGSASILHPVKARYKLRAIHPLNLRGHANGAGDAACIGRASISSARAAVELPSGPGPVRVCALRPSIARASSIAIDGASLSGVRSGSTQARSAAPDAQGIGRFTLVDEMRAALSGNEGPARREAADRCSL